MNALGFTGPLSWLPVLMIVGILLNGLRLRARSQALRRLADAGTDAPPAEGSPWAWLTAAGVELPQGLRERIGGHAQGLGWQTVDVVPADLPTGAALDLLRLMEPATGPTAALAPGRSAGQALAVQEAQLERAEVAPAAGTDPAWLARHVLEIQYCVGTAHGTLVVPELQAGPVAGRRARLHAARIAPALLLTAPAVAYLALAGGVWSNWPWGLAALLAFCLQPYLVFAGTPLRPRDLHRVVLLRLLWDPAQWLATVAGPKGAVAAADATARQAHFERSRPHYAAALVAGVAQYLEPRRATCPWCGGAHLAVLLTAPDLYQGKPGRFVLEQCADCRHVFQNPRLNLAGLDFYYRDFYDGEGADRLEGIFSVQAQTYLDRAQTVRPVTDAAAPPRQWLDVGTGHGHFCAVAAAAWPDTQFDGLDLSDGIAQAQRRGWVTRAYRGLFCDLAAELAGSYDVVSMSHYLEHTREPLAELDAAAQVLRPGGHLLIEVPDPEWPMGRLLKRFWIPWLQPQHQHLMPIANLKQALAARGLAVVGERRRLGWAHFELTLALYLVFYPWTRAADTPWTSPASGLRRRALRLLAHTVTAPVAILTVAADLLLAVPLALTGRSPAYRVVARKTASTPPEHF